MATISEKYRVNALAKDLGMKSKEVIDLLASHGRPGKSHMTVLEEQDLSIVFEYVTQGHQADLAEFFKFYEGKKKKAEVKKEEKKQDKEVSGKTGTKPSAPEKSDKQGTPAAGGQQKKQGGQPIQKKKDKTNVRVVDTRGTSSVDLSKYDDKIDNLYTSDKSDKEANGKQKIKKKQQNGKFGPKDKQSGQDKFKKSAPKPQPVKLTITVPDEISVSELASRMKKQANEVVKKLFLMGVMATINDMIDYDTAYLVADEFGITVNKEVVVTIEEKLIDDSEDAEESLKPRAPVVVVMGHVDHGKTSLLDAIRNAHVTAGEAGGITQHIGAYSVHVNGRDITFLDTPGHEAFTAMRARGANMTDIAVLVVAADDGIMPQTVEAISHAKAAGVTIIVAINKIDKPGANIDNVKQGLTQYELVPEEWGGDIICVPISAKTKQGIDELLEMIILSADMLDLKANPDRAAKGAIVEAKLDKGRGAVATVLVQNGTLHTGDYVIAGTSFGRVRAMTNDKGEKVKEAGPSVPVEITGLSEAPNAGDVFNVVADEKMARELIEQRKFAEKEESFKNSQKANLDDLFSQLSSGMKNLNIIVKADVQGSAEAVKSSLEKLSNEEVTVKVIYAGVGAVNESDVMLASASNAIIIGFNIRPDKLALSMAEEQKVEIRTYRVIYECIEEVEAAMKGMLAPTYKEVVIGRCEVRETFRVSSIGTIAGSYVTDGKVTRNSFIRVVRDGVVIFEDKIKSLRRFKDDVKEVNQGYECGIALEKFNDIKLGDVLEAYIMEEVAR